MKIYTAITVILFILINSLFVYYGRCILDKIFFCIIFSIIFTIIFGVLIPLANDFEDEYWELIGDTIINIYKQTIKIIKFYLNI